VREGINKKILEKAIDVIAERLKQNKKEYAKVLGKKDGLPYINVMIDEKWAIKAIIQSEIYQYESPARFQ
jgi:phage I-like protein